MRPPPRQPFPLIGERPGRVQQSLGLYGYIQPKRPTRPDGPHRQDRKAPRHKPRRSFTLKASTRSPRGPGSSEPQPGDTTHIGKLKTSSLKTRPPLRFIGTHVDEATYEAFSQAARASHRSRSAQVRHLIDLSLHSPSHPAVQASQPGINSTTDISETPPAAADASIGNTQSDPSAPAAEPITTKDPQP